METRAKLAKRAERAKRAPRPVGLSLSDLPSADLIELV